MVEREILRLNMEHLRHMVKECLQRLSEINHIAEKTPITICSMDDFAEICHKLNISDSNVEGYYGQYCFIEIGSTPERVRYDAYLTKGYDKYANDGDRYYSEGQYYFKNEHPNVLKLEFDDNINIGDNLTNVVLSKGEFRDGADLTHLPNTTGKGFKYAGAKGFSVEMADRTNDFIEANLQVNPGVKFIIHCRMGQSRSAAMGYYIAKRIKANIEEFLSEYQTESTFTNNATGEESVFPTSQFRYGHNRKGGIDTMNNRVSAMMDASYRNRRGDSKDYEKYKKQGSGGKFSLPANDEFHRELRDAAGSKENPKTYRSIKGFERK